MRTVCAASEAENARANEPAMSDAVNSDFSFMEISSGW